MNSSFYPISYWLWDQDVYVPTRDSWTFLSFALANEENQ